MSNWKSKILRFGKYTWSEITAMIADGYIPIANATELDGIRNTTPKVMGVGSIWEDEYVTGLDKKYIQINNILFEYDKTLPWPTGFLPFTSFSGIYDGNQLSISNLYINRPSTTGVSLFGTLTGKIYNLNVISAELVGKDDCAIISSFFRTTNGLIENVNIYSSLIRSGNVYATDVGGIVGRMDNGAIIRLSNVYNSTIRLLNFTSNNRVGGIASYCGWTSGAIIELCQVVNCDIIGRGSGGIVASTRFNTTRVRNCTVIGGSISSYLTSTSGGLIDRNAVLLSGSQIINCLSTALVEGGGGFCGTNDGVISNCYYDKDTSGQSDTGKGLPRTTQQMKEGTADSIIAGEAMYTGWSNNIWNFRTNLKYPKIRKI